MGRLISSSGLPENLIPRSFEDIQSQWIAKVEDVKCASVIGAFAYLTHDKFINALIKKNVGIVLSDSAYNRRIITKQKKGKNSFVPDQEYKPIRKLNLKGISGENMDILNKTTNVENEAFRFILQSQIEIEKKGEVDSTYIQPMLHAKMLGLVDKNGIVYEWLTGGHNPTLNGNDSIDCFTSITDPKKINEYTDYWVYLWIESKILDRDKSLELINAVNYNSRDSNTVARAWKQAHFTVSKYMDKEVDSHFCAHDRCPNGMHHFLFALKNRKKIVKISQDSNIPIGIQDKYLEKFQDKSRFDGLRLKFFSLPESKQESLIMYKDGKIRLHNLLKNIFDTWLDEAPSKQGERYKDINGKSNSELEAAPEPTNNGANSELNTTLEIIEKIQKQQKQFEDTLNEILERLNGTQDEPTGEIIFNEKFGTNNGKVARRT